MAIHLHQDWERISAKFDAFTKSPAGQQCISLHILKSLVSLLMNFKVTQINLILTQTQNFQLL